MPPSRIIYLNFLAQIKKKPSGTWEPKILTSPKKKKKKSSIDLPPVGSTPFLVTVDNVVSIEKGGEVLPAEYLGSTDDFA